MSVNLISEDRSSYLFENYRLATRKGSRIAVANEEQRGAYVGACEALLSELCPAGWDPNRVEVSFHLNSCFAHLKNLDTEEEVGVDCLALEGETKDSIDRYFDSTNAGKFQRGKFASHSIGDLNGPRALQRATEQSRSLPQAGTQFVAKKLASKPLSERKVLVKRVLFVEHIQQSMKQNLENLKASKSAEREQAMASSGASDRLVGNLQREINALEEQIQGLKDLDLFALTTALLNYPIRLVSDQDRMQIERQMEKELSRMLLPKREGLEKLKFWKTPSLDERDVAYIRDVIGLMHSDSRHHFSRYSEENRTPMKKEGFAHLLFRAAVDFANTEDEDGLTSSEFQRSIATHWEEQNFSLELTTCWNGQASIVGAQITSAFHDGAYRCGHEIDSSTPEELREQVEASRVAQLEREFAAHRERVLSFGQELELPSS